MKRTIRFATAALAVAGALGAVSCSYTTDVDNTPGRETIYEDPNTTSSRVAGVGTESQDIIAMADQMARDILATDIIVNRPTPPRLILDANNFTRSADVTADTPKLIHDRIRVALQRASQGRLIIVGRQNIDVVEKERELKREGIVDGGTVPPVKATAGADFRMVGNITTLQGKRGNMASRYHQATFELIDLETGEIVWSNIYEFRKAAADDVIYR